MNPRAEGRDSDLATPPLGASAKRRMRAKTSAVQLLAPLAIIQTANRPSAPLAADRFLPLNDS